MPAAPTSPSEFLDLVRKSGVVTAERLAAAVPDPDSLPAEPQKAATFLIQKGLITRFQAQQLLAGRHKGFRLGAYAVLDQLGRGGMGAVYLAEHTELRRKVAIKVLIAAKDDDQKLAVERFLREARAAAALDHPNIVRIFDVCRHGETPYLVMEHVDGETLQQILDRDGSIPYTTAADYIAQAAAGLQHAHEKGFVHRDIKPGNLIRDKSGTVKILDMGLARSNTSEQDKLTEKLDAGAVVGTADFIAPEQALNAGPIDIRADIYSLGASLYTLINGKPPFDGNTAQKLLQHQMTIAPNLSTFDPTLPKGVVGVVAKMLAKKPADRFQAPAEIIAGLAPWLGNSSRILAGLSRTNLGQGAELHATLNEFARQSSARMGGGRRSSGDVELGKQDSGEVDPTAISRDTGEIASAETTRSPVNDKRSKKRKAAREAEAKRNSRRQIAIFCAGLVLLVVAGVGAMIAFGGKSDDSNVIAAAHTPEPGEDVLVPRTTDPTPAPKDNTPPVPAGQLIHRLDFSDQKPFRVRGGPNRSPSQVGRDVTLMQTSKTGAGNFPSGWLGTPYAQDSDAEFWVEPRAGRTVLGLRNLQKNSAMLLSPDLNIPGGKCRIRFEYMTEAGGDRVGIVKFKSTDKPGKAGAGLLELFPLRGTNGSWRTIEANVDVRGLTHGFFEIHNSDVDPTHNLCIAVFEVSGFRDGPEPVLFTLDLSGQKSFAIQSGLELNTANPPQKVAKILSKKGPGEPPVGWQGRCFNIESQMEFFADSAKGGPALGIKNLRGPSSAMLFTPRFECPTSVCRIQFDYLAPTTDAKSTLRFKSLDQRGAWTVATLPPTGDTWRTENLVVDLKLASGGLFEFHMLENNVPLRIRNLTIKELPAGTTVANKPGNTATSTAPTGPDYSHWAVGDPVYQLDIASLAPFRVSKEGSTVTAGDPEQLPPGIFARCWKAMANGEFRRSDVEGTPALGLTNFTDLTSAQFVFELEKGMKLSLKPGAVYRAQITYMTKNDATGGLAIQTQDYKSVSSSRLENTGGQWKSESVHFERRESVPVRLTIDNTSVGEGNTLYFRSLDLFELSPPGK